MSQELIYIQRKDIIQFQKALKQLKIKHWPITRAGNDWYSTYIFNCPKVDFLKLMTTFEVDKS